MTDIKERLKYVFSKVNCFEVLGISNDELDDGLTFNYITKKYNEAKNELPRKQRINKTIPQSGEDFKSQRENLDKQAREIEYAYFQISSNKNVIGLRNVIAKIAKDTNNPSLEYPYEEEMDTKGRIVDVRLATREIPIVEELKDYEENLELMIKEVARVRADVVTANGEILQNVGSEKFQIKVPSSEKKEQVTLYCYANGIDRKALRDNKDYQKVFLQEVEKGHLDIRNKTNLEKGHLDITIEPIPHIGTIVQDQSGMYFVKKDKQQEEICQRAEKILEKREKEKNEGEIRR